MSEVATQKSAPPAETGRSRARFLRRGNWFFALLALPFVASVAGALGLWLVYHWPYLSVPVYYLIVRPPFIWFGMLAPLLVFGLPALRWRWLALGCGLWILAFLGTQEVLPCLKPFGGRARERFWAAQMGFRSYMAEGPVKEETLEVPLRIITWNVHEGRGDPYRNVEQLGSLEPDIVLMQEFGPGRGTNMAQAVNEAAAFRGYQLDGIRRAILSRWPIEQLSDNPIAGELGSAWRVRVAPGLSLVCLNVHLTPLPIKTQLLRGWSWSELAKAIERTRRELDQVRAALDHYARQGPVVLAGDFNLPPYYPDLRRARGRFLDCFARGGYGWGKTAPARLPAMRPDQIYVPPGSHVYFAAAVPTRRSDHYMTLAEVAVPVAVRALPPQSVPPGGAPEETHER